VIVVGIVLAAVLGACDTTSGPPGSSLKRPVELWTRGDDGLTQRFSEAFEDAIRGDTNLTLALGNEARTTSTIVATIQEHLNWKSVGPKTEVSYRIEFENATGKKLGNSIGSCWEDELQTCVNRALGDLRRAAEETN
jgi:hypothetical protein